jgi:peptidoglycan/LPS O-acetylase OafA/YrhL
MVGVEQDRRAAWDGLRGLAVAAVLVYHVEGHPLSGGFLGVSMFFTLSGFLITTIVVSGRERTGAFDATTFWARRFRRLVPAMLACLVLVLAFGHFAASPNQQADLGWDMVSAATDWSNWRFLLTGQQYGGAVVDPSPVLHTWSLSIEVQVYLVLPVVLVLALRRSRRTAIVAVGVLTAASIVSGFVTAHDGQQWYLGTHVRAQEILIGSLVALVVRTRHCDVMHRVAARAWPVAVIGLAAAWWWASETDRWLPRGGLAIHAVATATLILAATMPGVLGTALSWRPLTALGRISYGVYLYHWPLYLWISPRRLGLDPWPTTAVRVAVTLMLATASYVLLERRIMAGSGSARRTAGVGVGALAVASVMALVLVPRVDSGDQITVTGELLAPPTTVLGAPPPSGLVPVTTTPPQPSATGQQSTTSGAPTSDSTPATLAPTTTIATSEPRTHVTPALVDVEVPAADIPRILIIGDSAASTFGPGVQSWSSYLGLAEVYSYGWLACPLTIGGDIRWNDGIVAPIPERCDDLDARRRDLASVDPDLVVIYSGLWEIVDRRLPGRDDWVHVGQPVMDAEVVRQLSEITDLVLDDGRRVLWMLQPPVRNSIYAQLPGPLPEEDPARMERLNEIISTIAADRDNVWTLDVPAVFTDLYDDPLALDNRTDGFHWSVAGAERDGSWMAPLFAEVAVQEMAG